MKATAQRFFIEDYTKKTAAREMNDGILAFVTDFPAIKTMALRTLSIGATMFKERENDN
ncbi:hypothetical protein D3C81_1842720 [compost metagenome]